MKKILVAATALLTLGACHKATTSLNTESFADIETDVINDFVNKTALPQYDSLVAANTALNNDALSLQAGATSTNLAQAQADWKLVRKYWEQCEGFLIGPVEAYSYDPNTDTWPTDHTQLDSLLASSNPLSVSDVASLSQNLRGYHPIEYLIFRNGESVARTPGSFTARELQYLVSLTADVLDNNVKPLLSSWTSAPVAYAQAISGAGSASNQVYPTKLSFFLDVSGDNGMAGICNEVGEQDPDGKMYEPFVTRDSTITESPYSDNSLTDFKNNIIGAQNVYMGINGGKGIKDLVAAKNKDLDNQIQAQFTATINSFNNIYPERYEQAILDNRSLVQATLSQLQTLESLLDTDLVNFLKNNVKD
ncbi:MAG TPA: imelysin family protein [Dinghuibacter sp.]|jgi:predicted lipoprotein|uniref:imelysin family protein n=1 Tax=Dinghuibacter sp. TaxID=2024697 RepID=UPI002B835C60|nr:imelysin family protein [Dinghuibacter sp.]HTJ10745.1 imelysin family protein [Dinghuibacter sp.]